MSARRWYGHAWHLGGNSGRRVEAMHATRGGGPVLTDHASWRTVNGFAVRIGDQYRWVLFRRFPKW